MVLTSTCNGFDGKIESTHRAALVLEEPMTQYGWARLGIESINLHKRGWRSHPLPVNTLYTNGMGSEACPLYSCAEGTHTHTFGRVVQILLLSIIYIQRKLPLLLQSATIRCDGHTQESDLCKHGGKWLCEAISHFCLSQWHPPTPSLWMWRPLLGDAFARPTGQQRPFAQGNEERVQHRRVQGGPRPACLPRLTPGR